MGDHGFRGGLRRWPRKRRHCRQCRLSGYLSSGGIAHRRRRRGRLRRRRLFRHTRHFSPRSDRQLACREAAEDDADPNGRREETGLSFADHGDLKLLAATQEHSARRTHREGSLSLHRKGRAEKLLGDLHGEHRRPGPALRHPAEIDIARLYRLRRRRPGQAEADQQQARNPTEVASHAAAEQGSEAARVKRARHMGLPCLGPVGWWSAGGKRAARLTRSLCDAAILTPVQRRVGVHAAGWCMRRATAMVARPRLVVCQLTATTAAASAPLSGRPGRGQAGAAMSRVRERRSR